jgi:hydroxymethylpyrimidine pyrophosphatase-like HAD family hydrolase
MQVQYKIWYEKCVDKAPSSAKDRRERGKQLLEQYQRIADEQKVLIEQLQAEKEQKQTVVNKITRGIEIMSQIVQKAAADNQVSKLEALERI